MCEQQFHSARLHCRNIPGSLSSSTLAQASVMAARVLRSSHLKMKSTGKRSIEIRRESSLGTSWSDRRSRTSWFSIRVSTKQADRTLFLAADKRRRRQYRPAACRAPCGWWIQCPPNLRPDSRTEGTSRHECRGCRRFCARLINLLNANALFHGVQECAANRIQRPSRRCAHPARLRSATVSRVIRSQRDCILNGTARIQFLHGAGEFSRPAGG